MVKTCKDFKKLKTLTAVDKHYRVYHKKINKNNHTIRPRYDKAAIDSWLEEQNFTAPTRRRNVQCQRTKRKGTKKGDKGRQRPEK